MTVQHGKALILRTCDANMRSHGGFQWPESGEVAAPDWKPTAECGNGLHGFLWGEGNGNLAEWGESARWVVAEIDQWIDIGGKVKFPRANVLFAGDRLDATEYLKARGGTGRAIIGSTNTGGDGSINIGGDYSANTGGDYSTNTGGDRSTNTGGRGSTNTGGDGSILIFYWWDNYRTRATVAYVGEDGIKPNVPYRLDDSGKVVPA